MEIWKDIKGLEGLYQVSNHGRIKSLKRKLIDGRVWEERIMKTPLSSGYTSVAFRVNNKYFKERVHRLVGFAFLEGYKPGYLINHKDGNKLNNHFSNLEWCDSAHNANHAFITGLNKGIKAMIKINNKKTVQLDFQGNLIQIYDSAKEAAKKINCPIQNITRVCRKERKSARGYKWMYLIDYENTISK
jgi:hypothetical protein